MAGRGLFYELVLLKAQQVNQEPNHHAGYHTEYDGEKEKPQLPLAHQSRIVRIE